MQPCIQEKNIALIQQHMGYIVEKLEKLDTTMSDFIKESQNKFATKEEMKKDREDIEALKKDNQSINLIIAKTTGMAVAAATILSFLMNKMF